MIEFEMSVFSRAFSGKHSKILAGKSELANSAS